MVFFKRGDSLQQDFAALLLLEQARDAWGCSLGTQGCSLDA